MEFTWRRGQGYEVSSKGDKRFSALHATLSDGRTVEMHYQCDVKGYDPGGTNWKAGKGKPPTREISEEALFEEYLSLWRQWAMENPDSMYVLLNEVEKAGGVLSDCFAHTPINQTRTLAQLLNEWFMDTT